MAAAAVAAAASRTFLLHPGKFPETFRFLSISSFRCPITATPRRSVAAFSSSLCAASAAPATSSSVRNVVDVLRERGLIDAVTNEAALSAAAASPGALRAYCGFDPTAESLHLGNLIGLIVLSWFQRCGHLAVAVVGGATALVGDPSGKSAERPELDAATVERNAAAIKSLISDILSRNIRCSKDQMLMDNEQSFSDSSSQDRILETNLQKDSILTADRQFLGDFSAKGSNLMSKFDQFRDSFIIVDNYDWWKDFTLLGFLKEVGRFARVGTMMAKESVKKRLNSEEGMSFTEFTYQLLQGHDFLYMFKNFGVNVQIGGSDQWGNITAGTELIRKILQVNGAYGLTFPLLLKGDGSKFGKSEGGAIWLSPSMLSSYKFYQYFFMVPDADAVRFLKILTFLSMDEIHELEQSMGKPDYVPNSIQRRLAEEVTRFVRGEEGLKEALMATEALKPGTDTELDAGIIEGIADDVPSCSLEYDQILNSSLVDLTVSTGLLASKSAVRRLVKQGGLYLNNRRIDNEEKVVEAGDIVGGKVLLLSAGKKNKMVIRVS